MVAILSPEAVLAVRLTVDEYLQADLPEGHRYELVDGVIEMSPTPDGSHDEVLDILQEALYLYRRDHVGAFTHLSQRATVPIPGFTSVREPDLALYREWNSMGRGFRVWKEFAPFWVAEVVSLDQEDRDYEQKPHDYWLAGVSEYWIVDRHERHVVVMVRGSDKWMKTIYQEQDQVISPALPSFVIPASKLLGHTAS